jgi:hypothetical protein
MFVTSLAGHRLAHFENAFSAAPDRSPGYPEHAQWVAAVHAREGDARAHRAAESRAALDASFVGAEQGRGGVTAVLERRRRSGARSARYLIGADGAQHRSRGIGAKLEGATACRATTTSCSARGPGRSARALDAR